MPPTKQLAREVFLRTLNSIDILAVMAQKIELTGNRVVLPGGAFEFSNGAQFRIVAIGKAAHAMTAGLVALAPEGTEFQRRVWTEIGRIPHGETLTYAQLAARAGASGSARAAGAATGRNPISIVVPCHRVLGSDGSLTGYAGGLERKTKLLEIEGVLQASLV